MKNIFKDFLAKTTPISEEAEKALEKTRESMRLNDLRRVFEQTAPIRFRDCSLDNYKTLDNPKIELALSVCKSQLSKQINVILYGEYGNGKTHLCYGMQRAAHMTGKSTYYFTVKTLVRHLKENESWRNDRIINKIANADLVIIEELGRSVGSKTEKSDIFEIIDRRYGAMKPTIITSNLRGDMLEAEIGQGLISRLTGASNSLILCDWDDYRQRNSTGL